MFCGKQKQNSRIIRVGSFRLLLPTRKTYFFLSKKSLLCRLIFNRKKGKEIINDSYFKRISYYRLMFVNSMKIIQVKHILIQHILFCKMWVQLEQNIFDIIFLLFLLYHCISFFNNDKGIGTVKAFFKRTFMVTIS